MKFFFKKIDKYLLIQHWNEANKFTHEFNTVIGHWKVSIYYYIILSTNFPLFGLKQQ